MGAAAFLDSQAESLGRIIGSLSVMPQLSASTLSNLTSAATWSQVATASASNILENIGSPMLQAHTEAFSASIAPIMDVWPSIAPSFDFSKIVPKMDWKAVIPSVDFSKLVATAIPAWLGDANPALFRHLDLRRETKRDLSADTLPPNLRPFASSPGERDHLDSVLLHDGVPLAYALSVETVEAVLEERDAASRVARIWSRRAGILSTCEQQLGRIHADHLQHKADLAWQAIQAFRADLHGPAQAQAIAVMDTHFTIEAPLKLEKLILDERNPHKGLQQLDRRAFPVLAPISAVFNRPFKGQAHKYGQPRQKEPRELSRQATVHGASARQYTKRNALLSIAMLTSLLCLLQDEHSRAAFSRA